MKFNPRFAPIFAPASRRLDFSAVPGFDVRGLIGVYNVSANALIYGAGIPNLGASAIASGLIMTLQFDTTAMTAFDILTVIYDDGLGGADASNLYQLMLNSVAGGFIRAPGLDDLLRQILVEMRTMNLTLAAGLNITTDDVDALRSEYASERHN